MTGVRKLFTCALVLSLAGSSVFAQKKSAPHQDSTIIHLESGEVDALLEKAHKAEASANTWRAYESYSAIVPSDSQYAAYALNKTQKLEEVYQGFEENNPDSMELLWKARAYEAKKNYVYALGYYYDAVLADPAYANEAFISYNRLAEEIRNGNPGAPAKDAKSAANEWNQIQKNVNKYWNDYCPYTIRIGALNLIPESLSNMRPDYGMNVTFEESDKYQEIMGLLGKGYKKATGEELVHNPGQYNVRIAVRYMKKDKRLLPTAKYVFGDDYAAFRKVSKSAATVIADREYVIVPVAVYQVLEDGAKEKELDINNVDISVLGRGANERYILNPYKKQMAILNMELKMAEIPDKTFLMGKTEVTCAEYDIIMNEKSHEENLSNTPKTNVTWFEAVEFCNRLSEETGLNPCYEINGEKVFWNKRANGYRLPTSDEWEIAAKAGRVSRYAGGDLLDEVAWYGENSGNQVHEVGLKLPNNYGLYDMSGNASEWCWTPFSDEDYNRIRRGGSFSNHAFYCEVTDQDYCLPNNQYEDLGFRLCRNVSDDAKEMIEAGIARSQADDARNANRRKKQELNNMGLKKDIYIKMPDHRFYMNPEEVTQDLYELLMGTNPSDFKGAKNPVENVTWYDALLFCNKLSAIKGYTPVYIIEGKRVTWNEKANGYRLPTTEEWEFAAKGGVEFAYSGSSYLDDVAWYNKNSNGVTHPVALKVPNDYGLYDMSGNVWEWTWDLYAAGKQIRCVRGGSFNYSAACCEVEYNNFDFPGESSNYLGFRVCRGPVASSFIYEED